MEQKQEAFRTAQNFHKDPSSVSMADAKSAASTANNFRARHQDQIAAGAQKANGWNKKYNVTGRVNSFLEKQASPVSEQPPSEVQAPLGSPTPANINRKPPPPPPPKKPSGMHAPPPVPLGTKPSFGWFWRSYMIIMLSDQFRPIDLVALLDTTNIIPGMIVK
jgi:hypothetical protein